MSTVHYLVKDDTATTIQATLTRSHDGSVINCGDATVRLKFREKGKTNTLFTLTSLDAGDDLQVGVAKFRFGGTNLDVSEGYYEGEIEITFQDGTVETVYETLDFYVRADFE
jgi:hypothetical protein